MVIHGQITVKISAVVNPAVVINPKSDFDAPKFSAKIGKKPKVTPKVTNCNVIATNDTFINDGDFMVFNDCLNL